VSDNAEVIGCEEDKMQDRLTNILQDHCHPAPRFTVAGSTVQGKPLLVIAVPEGDDKPYEVKRKGIYVRVGATKHHATRYELDLMYARKTRDPWNTRD